MSSKRILFVDDEPNVLDGLRRMLRGMRHEWDMSFAQSGEEALKILSGQPFDVVVSDMRMPGMDGAQLLTKVMDQYPEVVRIVLSGQSEQEMILKSVGPAHQYLTKPCEADTLKAVVGRACALRDLLKDESLQRVISRLESLPSIPALYFELMEEIKSPESSMKKIGEIISKDVGMSAKILQLVNSAFFGLPQRISSPAQAASLLGLDIVRALVLSTHVFTQFKPQHLPGLSFEELWSHSGTAGVCAKEITRIEVSDRKIIDDAFMAGILHDVGILILAGNVPEKYREVLDIVRHENIRLFEAETRVFGATHAEVGGYLLGLWGLPDTIVEAVFFHHTPAKQGGGKFAPLAAVHVASSLEAERRGRSALHMESFIDENYLSSIGKGGRLPEWKNICQRIFERETGNE